VGKKKKHSEATPSIASVSINTQLTQRTKAAPEIPLVQLAAQRGARKTTIFKKTTPLGRQPDNYPLPRLEDLLHSTGDTVFTSTVDLKAGYCRDTFIGSTKILLRLKVKNPPILYTIDTIMTHKILLGTMEVFLLYYQIRVAEADQDKTAFITPFGIYRFTRLPFGLRNAPATFQTLIGER
jgi:hypothetical protein